MSIDASSRLQSKDTGAVYHSRFGLNLLRIKRKNSFSLELATKILLGSVFGIKVRTWKEISKV